MPLTYNGNAPSAVTYNGNPVSIITYNMVEVWRATPPRTEYYFSFSEPTTQKIYISQSAANAVIVNWGDNTTTIVSETTDAEVSHNYDFGDYIATITCASGESWTANSLTSGHEAVDPITTIYRLRLDNGVTLAQKAFMSCESIGRIDIESGAVSLGIQCFQSCTGLSQLNIASGGISVIPARAFRGCTSLSSVSCPDTITSLGQLAFEGCSGLETLNTGNGATEVSNTAFQNCSSLKYVTLGSSLATIGNYAFRYCTSMRSITCYAVSPPSLGSQALTDVPASIPIYVPSGSVSAYKQASGWSDRAAYIQAIP